MKISQSIAERMLVLISKIVVYRLNILCKQQCKVDDSKCFVAAMGFAITDKHFKWL